MASSTHRGRPKTDLIDRLRIIMWSHAVLKSSGAADIQALETELAEKYRIRLASGLWSRYMRGDVLPQGALAGSKSALPVRLETHYPMTLWVFNNDLWAAIRWDPIVDTASIRECYLRLGDDVSVHFVAKTRKGQLRSHPERSVFWHLQKSPDSLRRVVADFSTWEQIVVCLLEAKMAYAAQRHEAFVSSQLLACAALKKLQSRMGPVRASLPGVFYMLEALCLDPLYICTVNPPPHDPKTIELRDKCMAWASDWELRCIRYLHTLSPKAVEAFENRLRTGTVTGKNRNLIKRMVQHGWL